MAAVRPNGRSWRRRSAFVAGLALLAPGVAASATFVHSAAASPTNTTSGEAMSRLWSGYAASSGAMYRSISGSWTVPTALCLPEDDSPASAQWIGLDGYGSSTIEQAGTGMKCKDGGQPTYWAWAELDPIPAMRVPFPVSPGDRVTVDVTASSPASFTVRMSDTSSEHAPWTWTQSADAPARTGWPVTAEAVAEAVPVGTWPVEVLPTTAVVFTDVAVTTIGDGFTGGFDGRFLTERIVRQGPTSISAPGPLSPEGSTFSIPTPLQPAAPADAGVRDAECCRSLGSTLCRQRNIPAGARTPSPAMDPDFLPSWIRTSST